MTARILEFPSRTPAEQGFDDTRVTPPDSDGEEIVVRVILDWTGDDEPAEPDPRPEPTGRRNGFWWFLLGVLLGAS